MIASNKVSKILICLSVLLSLAPSASSADQGSDDYINYLHGAAEKTKAWNSLEWRKLVHYEEDSSQESNVMSQDDDVIFFNASDGKTNPKAELK